MDSNTQKVDLKQFRAVFNKIKSKRKQRELIKAQPNQISKFDDENNVEDHSKNLVKYYQEIDDDERLEEEEKIRIEAEKQKLKKIKKTFKQKQQKFNFLKKIDTILYIIFSASFFSVIFFQIKPIQLL